MTDKFFRKRHTTGHFSRLTVGFVPAGLQWHEPDEPGVFRFGHRYRFTSLEVIPPIWVENPKVET